MAPEQIRGLPDIDTRADIYALGATLFHMVTGQYPFDGPTASAIMTRHVTDPPPSARTASPSVSRACDELIQRMMAKDPDDRPQTPADLLADIDDALAGRVHLRPGPRTKTRALAGAPKHRKARPSPGDVGGASLPVGGASLPRVRRSNTLGWAFAGIGLLVLAIVLIVLATRGGGPKPPPTDAGQLALQQADAYAKQHPSDCDGAIARYQAVASQHGGTQWAAIATGRVEELRKAKAAASVATKASRELQAAIAKLQADARGLAGKDRFGDALKTIADFAATHKEPAAADAADTLKAEVLAKAGRRFDTLADAADDAKGAGDYAKARATLQPVLAFGVPGLVEAAKRKLARYDEEEKNAEHLAKWDAIKTQAAKLAEGGKYDDALKLLDTAKAIPLDDMADRVADEVAAVEDARRDALDKVLAAYAAESEKVWAAFKERDYAAADRLLAELAKKPELQPAADALAADQQAAGLLKAFWAAVEEGLRLRVGQFLAFGGEGGTIAAVKDGQVTLNTPKGEATLPLVKLSAKQALLYVLLKDDARSHLTKGVFLLAEQTDLDAAVQALASAGDAPHAAAYRDRLDGLRLGAAEHAACKAWAQIQSYAKAKLTGTGRARLLSMIGAFQERFGDTALRKSVQPQIAELMEHLAESGPPRWAKIAGVCASSSITSWGHPDQVHDGVVGKARNGLFSLKSGWVKVDLGSVRPVAGFALYPVLEADGGAVCTPSKFLVLGARADTRFKNGVVDASLGSMGEDDPGGKYALLGEFKDVMKRDASQPTQFSLKRPARCRFLKFVFLEELQSNVGLRQRITVGEIRVKVLGGPAPPVLGAWQSLFDGKSLRGWKIVEEGVFARHGRVGVRDGRILLERGDPKTAIARAGDFPTVDYEIAVEAMRTTGEGDFCDIIFPLAASRAVLYVGGWGGGTVGLAIDGHGASNNVSTRKLKFENGRWYRLRLRVTEARIRFWIDDRPLIDLVRADHTLQRSATYDPVKSLGLQSHGTSAALRNIRLRRLGPEAEARGEAPKAGEWQSLFDGKSLRGWRKSTRGKFARPGAVLVEDGVLVVGGGKPWTAVACTQKLPTLDYELELEARRVNGLEDFCDMLFPVGTGYGRLMAGGDGGGRLAVSVKTPVAEGQGTVRTWHRFHSDRWYRLRLRVSRARFEVFVDDQRLLDAPTASIGVELKDGYEDLVPLGIFTWDAGSHLRNIRLRRLH